MIDLSTRYLGLSLANPLVPSPSPLCEELDNIRRMEDAGAAAVVLRSLFEEQIELESHHLDRSLSWNTEQYGESVTYFPDLPAYNLGPDAYLFYDQFVVKGADAGMKLSWHQDSGYVSAVDGDPQHRPYITCWCPLDDVTEENGTVYILPQGTSGIRHAIAHWHDPASNDWVGYDGPLDGVPVRVRRQRARMQDDAVLGPERGRGHRILGPVDPGDPGDAVAAAHDDARDDQHAAAGGVVGERERAERHQPGP